MVRLDLVLEESRGGDGVSGHRAALVLDDIDRRTKGVDGLSGAAEALQRLGLRQQCTPGRDADVAHGGARVQRQRVVGRGQRIGRAFLHQAQLAEQGGGIDDDLPSGRASRLARASHEPPLGFVQPTGAHGHRADGHLHFQDRRASDGRREHALGAVEGLAGRGEVALTHLRHAEAADGEGGVAFVPGRGRISISGAKIVAGQGVIPREHLHVSQGQHRGRCALQPVIAAGPFDDVFRVEQKIAQVPSLALDVARHVRPFDGNARIFEPLDRLACAGEQSAGAIEHRGITTVEAVHPVLKSQPKFRSAERVGIARSRGDGDGRAGHLAGQSSLSAAGGELRAADPDARLEGTVVQFAGLIERKPIDVRDVGVRQHAAVGAVACHRAGLLGDLADQFGRIEIGTDLDGVPACGRRLEQKPRGTPRRRFRAAKPTALAGAFDLQDPLRRESHLPMRRALAETGGIEL